MWQPLVEAVGQEFGDEGVTWGADTVELTGIRRLLEPFEFGCALHYDKPTAIEHGYPDVVAPVSAVQVFAIRPMWQPGDDPVFPNPERNAEPERWLTAAGRPPMAPRSSAAFMTDVEWDFLLPVIVGDRVGIRNRRKIVSCTPKELRVGKGAFLTLEQNVVNQRGETVMRVRQTSFSYEPAKRG
jgi:hypothetical protein